jgi:hypothetical protein
MAGAAIEAGAAAGAAAGAGVLATCEAMLGAALASCACKRRRLQRLRRLQAALAIGGAQGVGWMTNWLAGGAQGVG